MASDLDATACKGAKSRKMLQLMTWSEIIENVKLEGQLKMASIFDSNGVKVAETNGAKLKSDEALGIWKCLDAYFTSIYGILLMGSMFKCFRVDNDTLIGKIDKSLLVAHRSQKLLIVAVSGLNSNISCLATVKNFAERLVEEGTPGVSVPSLM